MKAAVLRGAMKMEIITLPWPSAGPGEVVVRVRSCGVCGSDVQAWRWPVGLTQDCVLGHEIAGEIAEVGEDVEGWREGDRVAVLPYAACGSCRACRDGMETLCVRLVSLGAGRRPGGYADFLSCPSGSLFRLPDSMSFRRAALVEPLAVGLHAVERAGINPGAAILIIGGGPIGLTVLLWAKHHGAIVAIAEPDATRRALAERLGADFVLDPAGETPALVARRRLGRSPEVVFDCAGASGTLAIALSAVAPQGRIIGVGYGGAPEPFSARDWIRKEASLICALGYSRAEYASALATIQANTIDPEAMVTDIISLDELPRVMATLGQSIGCGKVIVETAF